MTPNDEATKILMHVGHDMAELLAHCLADKVVRQDSHGWLGLSGVSAFADFNMGAVGYSAPTSLLADYVREIRARNLSAILIVDAASESLSAAAQDLGLTAAGTVPVMLRHAAPIATVQRGFTVRRAARADVPVANALMTAAFALDRENVDRVLTPDYLSDSVETWLVVDAGVPIGCGTFVRTAHNVGIYCMSTPPEHQKRGIGRAVLEHAMQQYQDAGVTSFTLEATAQGRHLYEQAGFHTLMEAPVFVIGASTQFPT